MILTWMATLKENSYVAHWKHFKLYTWKHHTKDLWRGDIAVINENNCVSDVIYEHPNPNPTTLEESQEILETELYNHLVDQHAKALQLIRDWQEVIREHHESA